MAPRPGRRGRTNRPARPDVLDAAAVVRAGRPGYEICAAGCGWPVDPAALAGGFDRHPGCEEPPRTAGPYYE